MRWRARGKAVLRPMPVDTHHPSYVEAASKWQRVRDVLAGVDALRAGNYIPRLHEQTESDYKAYKDRACYGGAPIRAHEAMVGVMSNKPYLIETILGDEVIQNIDLRGSALPVFVRWILSEMSSVGRSGTLIDWNEELGRPYVVSYTAEEIINWIEDYVDGRPVLRLLVIKVCECQDGPDEFSPAHEEKYIVYRLSDQGVVSEEYRNGSIVKSAEMRRRGQPLSAIPWVWHGTEIARGCAAPKPPLLELADVAISQYRTSADLENGRHMCGIPTPWAVGFAGTKLYLGSAFAWTSENTDAKAGFLEFSGAGLNSLTAAMEEKSKQMAALGSRLLESGPSSAEAHETIALRNASESSCLGRIATMASASIKAVLQWAQWWGSTSEFREDEKVSFEIPTDFSMSPISSEMITALTSAYLASAISFDSYFAALKRGGLYDEARTAEEERQAIADSPPPGLEQPPQEIEDEVETTS